MEYIFKGKHYPDIFALAKDLYQDMTWAKEIRKKEFLDFVSVQDARKGEKINHLLLLSIPDDVLLFRAGEILNPFLPFSFHGYQFENYEELGNQLLAFSPNPNGILETLLRYELVSEHMKTTLYLENHRKEYENVRKIEKISRDDLPYAYYLLGYELSHATGIIYDHVLYQDIYNLTYFLAKKEKDLATLGSYLSFSPLLRTYSEYSKDGEKIKTYLHLVNKVDASAKALDQFLEKRKGKSEQ